MTKDKVHLVQKRLELFGTPACFILNKEGGSKKGLLDISKYYGLETALAINEVQPYQLAFAPNGNLGKVNKEGDPVRHKLSDAEDYISALVVDLDLKNTNYETKTDYLKYITDKIENAHLKISFLTETGGGFHGRIFIKEEDRYTVGTLLKGTNLKTIECKLAEMFDGGDPSSHSLVKLLRLPFSHYRKKYPLNTGEFECKLFKFTWDQRGNLVMQEMTKPDQINFDGVEQLSLAGVKGMLGNIKDEATYEVNYETDNPKDSSKFNQTCEEVNHLSIIEVIEKLSNYPREYKGTTYTLKVYNGNHIGIVKEDGQFIPTDGYMINTAKNFVHCFSDAYHPIEERPRGQTYPFLHHYFKGERAKLNRFLEDEYGITFSHGTDGAIESYLTFETDSGMFNFASDGVWCATNNGTKRVFPSPFEIKGAYKTRHTQNGETEGENVNYIIRLINDNSELTITPIFNDNKFNDVYGNKGLATKASKSQLIDFRYGLSVLASDGTIPSYDYRYLNGYYDDLFIVGNKVYNHEAEEVDIEPLNIILDTPNIEAYNSSEDVTVKDFGEKFRMLFSDRESMLTYVSFITLMMGHKFRVSALQEYMPQVLVPGLFLSGMSQSGKTTAITLCKHGFGLSADSKKFSVKGVTTQPITQASTDAWLLHLEERTGTVSEDKENIVRNILNKTTTARGLISGDNVVYNFRSSVVIDGETSPASESVINRCCYVAFYKEERLGNVEMINSFSSLNYFKDFIRRLYQIDKSSIWNTYKSKQKLLRENGLLDRIADNYAYILCVNEWFNIYPEDELLEAVRRNRDLDRTVGETRLDLSCLFTRLLIDRKIKATKTYVDEYVRQILIPISTEVLQQNKTYIMGVINRYGNDKIFIKGSNLIITYDSRDTSEKNVEIYQILNLFDSYLYENNVPDLVLS